MTTAAIYTRKSTVDERSHKDGKSIARQEELAHEFIARQPWVQGEVFSDDAISGAEFVNRPGYQRLMEAAKKGRFKVLVMMALNRLGRDQARVMMALTELHDAGVAVWTYQRGIEVKLDTAQDILIASVEAFADAAYRDSIRLNTREALRKKAERGFVACGRTFGYRNVKVDGHTERELNEVEAATVRRIYEHKVEGWGLFRICRELESLGMPSPRGKATWTQAQIGIILRNPLYRGEVVWGRTSGLHRGGTATRQASPDKVVRVQVPSLRIIDEKLWAAVQTTLDAAGEYYKRGLTSSPRVSPGLLSPIIRCGLCLGGMYLRQGTDQRSGKAYPSYACTRASTKGSKSKAGCKNTHRLPAERAEEALLNALAPILDNDRLAGTGLTTWDIIMNELARAERNQGDRASIEANIAESERQLGNLMKGLAMVGTSPAISKAIAEREADIAHLRVQLDGMQVIESADLDKMMQEAARKAIEWVGYLRGNSLGLAQGVLKKLFVEKITFTPGDKGVWTFKGKVHMGKVLEGILPKIPRSRPSSSW